MAILNANIHSVLKGRELYGEKGDLVTILSTHGEICIVEGPKKVKEEKGSKWLKVGMHRYPVKKENLIIQTIKNGTITN